MRLKMSLNLMTILLLLFEELNSWNVVIVVGIDSNKHLKM